MRNFFLTMLALVFIACNNNTTHIAHHLVIGVPYPQVLPLDSFKQTEFVPSPKILSAPDKNTIYCSAFLFAWDELKNNIPKVASEKSNYLKTLDTTSPFKNALAPNEYDREVSINEDLIKIHTSFSQTLSLVPSMDTLDKPFSFKGAYVKAFGMPSYNDAVRQNIIDILYYNSDNEFIVKLRPKNKEHEIILAKGFNNAVSLEQSLQKINVKIKSGQDERNKGVNVWWKYTIAYFDKLIIPVLRFNIETHYKSIEGDSIFTASKAFRINTAHQHIAFLLNEHGAKVESDADVVVTLDAIDPEQIPHPKLMIFNTPFIVLLRKVGRQPYFMMKVENAELMEKWLEKDSTTH